MHNIYGLNYKNKVTNIDIIFNFFKKMVIFTLMKPEQTPAVDIYNYFDYREYLQAEYVSKKQHHTGFSHRIFAREAGISSPNYLFRVLKG